MPFVVDASVALSWALDDESHPLPAAALSRLLAAKAWVPALWWFEVRNALLVNERRGRLSEADTALFLDSVARFPISIDRAPEDAMLVLARRHRLTVYDASYLELALRLGLPLASLDRDLRTAASAAA